MYSALTLIFLLGSASAETGYERNQAGNPKPVGTSPVAVPPPLPVLLAQQDPCLDNGMNGTTGRGAWPPMPVDPNSVQCVDVSTQWQNIKLCHASGVPEKGPSDAIYDKCHELYEENDCYRPGDINTGCIYDAILHCKSQYVSCSPPSAPCLDNGMNGTTGRGAWPPMPVDPNSVQCVDVSTQWQNIRLCHASGVPENGPSDAIYDKCHELYEENDCYRPGDINTGCIYDAILHCKSQYVSCSPPSAQPSPPSQPPSSPPPCAAGKQCRSEFRSCKQTCKNEKKTCKKCKKVGG